MKFPENITDEQVKKAEKILLDELVPTDKKYQKEPSYRLGAISRTLLIVLEGDCGDMKLNSCRKRYEEILQAVVDGEVSQ